MKENRPWGSFVTYLNLGFFKIKKITVNPLCRISLQRHYKRSELWFLPSFIYYIIHINDSYYTYFDPERFIYIKRKDIHRITNLRNKAFSFIELQFGICREDDIERFDDDYGRQ